MGTWRTALVGLLFACGGETGSSEDTAGTDADTDMPQAVDLHFAARFGAQPAACGTVYEATPYGSTTLEIGDLRFYASEISLIDRNGSEGPVELAGDGVWQGDGVALLDFEDGTGQCATTGNAGLNDHVVGQVPHGDYTGIAFTLGVPFLDNHQDVAFAPAPLNVPGMFWIWQYGYKFFRADLYNDLAAPGNLWAIHLGSNGCTAGTYYEAPTDECAQPNRPRIVLDGFDPASSTIVFDLAALLAGSDIDVDTEYTAPGCMSADEGECPELFDNLGLDYATGACANGCADQTAFRVE